MLALGRRAARQKPGVTRRIFSQWVVSMSVTRSLITGWFPIGSMTIGSLLPASSPSAAASGPGRSFSAGGEMSGPLASALLIRVASAAASPIRVLQASVDWPLIFIPQEPQIAARHEQRTASVPSVSFLACSSPSRTERVGSSSTSNVSQ